jgi:DNA-directed RNA polymerase subunit RPC12/RpoP
MRYLESSSNGDFLPWSYILCPLYVANPKISSCNNQGATTKKLAATYRCQSCKVIIQLVEIYSPTKRNAIYCPYCGKGVLEPRNVIFC